MMWQLAAGALAMLVLSTLFIIWPRKADAKNNQTPAQLFEERLQLLALARDAGELAEQDFDTAANELKQQFLEQEQQAIRYKQPKQQRVLHLSLVLVTALIVAVVYSQNGHYRQLSDWEYAQQNLASYGQRALLGEGEPLNEQDMQLFSLALRTKLANEGDDAVAWMLLGRVWMTLGMLEEAIESFERALKLMPERTPLLISYSQALIMLGGDMNLAKAGQSVARVLMQEPENIDAISLMALIAYERGDNAEAIAAWQLLASRLAPDDPRLEVVNARLAELNAPATVGTAEQNAAFVREVKVQVSVGAELAAAHPGASLFVFARAAEGPAIPLAAKRLPLVAGVTEISLSAADAMQAGWNIEQTNLIQVVARMAVSGTVERSAQDVEVVSAVLSFEQPVVSVQLTLEQ
ncbi:MAG: c-type cytochrome biogenesis protein CcmI [Alishewanella sp.]|nr:c-type cytochrome biogenesis protein CcmI [Alishewanella sp.]